MDKILDKPFKTYWEVKKVQDFLRDVKNIDVIQGHIQGFSPTQLARRWKGVTAAELAKAAGRIREVEPKES